MMSVSDYFLSCPTGHLERKGAHCELCLGGHEYRCVITRCKESYVGSAALALRTATARFRRAFLDDANVITVPTATVREFYLREGFTASRIVVLPNFVTMPNGKQHSKDGSYVAYVGRVSAEKGIGILLEAGRLSKVPLKIAGPSDSSVDCSKASSNLQFVGELSRSDVSEFLAKARYVVVPSICADVAPLAALEAMAAGKAIIASRIGGLPQMIPGEALVLVQPGDASVLADMMKELWRDPLRCRILGDVSRAHVEKNYSAAAHYERLLTIYSSLVAA